MERTLPRNKMLTLGATGAWDWEAAMEPSHGSRKSSGFIHDKCVVKYADAWSNQSSDTLLICLWVF